MSAVIDSTRANRAREIYDAALSQPDESAEWQALEAERDAHTGPYVGPSCTNKPHPQSAYAHLPMRGICTVPSGVTPGVAARVRALWPEPKRAKFRSPVSGKVVKDAKVLIKKAAPHPQSYRPDLPIAGLGLGANKSEPLFANLPHIYSGTRIKCTAKWTLTADEKRTLTARPLRYVRSSH